MVIQNILVTRDVGYLNVMALHNNNFLRYSDYFINVLNRLLSTMFLDNVWCIIPFQCEPRQSEMADLARRATSVCTKFHRDRLR